MRDFPKYTRLVVVLFLISALSNTVFAKSSKKRKRKSQLSNSISEAMRRSDTDQEKIRIRFDNETYDRIESWEESDLELIEIKHTGTSSISPVELGQPDFSYEETGDDLSGLDGLHSNVEEEPTDINFDEELRDVSSLKD